MAGAKGRPPKLENKRDERIIICFSPAEKKAIERVARGPLAVWAREVLLRAAAEATKPPDGETGG